MKKIVLGSLLLTIALSTAHAAYAAAEADSDVSAVQDLESPLVTTIKIQEFLVRRGLVSPYAAALKLELNADGYMLQNKQTREGFIQEFNKTHPIDATLSAAQKKREKQKRRIAQNAAWTQVKELHKNILSEAAGSLPSKQKRIKNLDRSIIDPLKKLIPDQFRFLYLPTHDTVQKRYPGLLPFSRMNHDTMLIKGRTEADAQRWEKLNAAVSLVEQELIQQHKAVFLHAKTFEKTGALLSDLFGEENAQSWALLITHGHGKTMIEKPYFNNNPNEEKRWKMFCQMIPKLDVIVNGLDNPDEPIQTSSLEVQYYLDKENLTGQYLDKLKLEVHDSMFPERQTKELFYAAFDKAHRLYGLSGEHQKRYFDRRLAAWNEAKEYHFSMLEQAMICALNEKSLPIPNESGVKSYDIRRLNADELQQLEDEYLSNAASNERGLKVIQEERLRRAPHLNLDLATERDDTATIKILLDTGYLKPTSPYNNHRTYYEFAARNGKKKIAHLLTKYQQKLNAETRLSQKPELEVIAAPAETPEQKSVREQAEQEFARQIDLLKTNYKKLSSADLDNLERRLGSVSRRNRDLLTQYFPERFPTLNQKASDSARNRSIPSAQQPKKRPHASSARQKKQNDEILSAPAKQQPVQQKQQLPPNLAAQLPEFPRVIGGSRAEARALLTAMYLTPAADAPTTHLVPQIELKSEPTVSEDNNDAQQAMPRYLDLGDGVRLAYRKLMNGWHDEATEKIVGMHKMNHAKIDQLKSKGFAVQYAVNGCCQLTLGKSIKSVYPPDLNNDEIVGIIKQAYNGTLRDHTIEPVVDDGGAFIENRHKFRGIGTNPKIRDIRYNKIIVEFVVSESGDIITAYPIVVS